MRKTKKKAPKRATKATAEEKRGGPVYALAMDMMQRLERERDQAVLAARNAEAKEHIATRALESTKVQLEGARLALQVAEKEKSELRELWLAALPGPASKDAPELGGVS